MTMAVTQDQIDKLEAAYARGDKVVRIGDNWVELAEGSDMWARLQNLKRLKDATDGAVSATKGSGRVSYVAHDKGL